MNFQEYIKKIVVKDKDGSLKPFRLSPIQMKVLKIIQDRLKSEGRIYPICRGRGF